ncbi:hypothetical protein Smic_15130 [Streptomyces microflavus]|uniref:ACT domain-containing protein n=1 Tax=Streptomyces microflavus TaxID=1919 RepID=A0A7J0CMP2_STRMI|nr:hypothetical protein Smic_15130 [Streptomyces microflavus]
MLNIVGNYSRSSPLSESRAGEDGARSGEAVRSRNKGDSRRKPCVLRPALGTGRRSRARDRYGGNTMSASQPPQPPSSPELPDSPRTGGEPARDSDDSPSLVDNTPTLLVKIFGKDRPGITAGLFDTLAAYSVDVVDIEQVVTRAASCCAPWSPRPPRAGRRRAICGPPCTAGPTP